MEKGGLMVCVLNKKVPLLVKCPHFGGEVLDKSLFIIS